MGVDKIYDFLKENKGFHSALQISDGVNVSHRAVKNSLNVIIRYPDITSKYAHLVRNKKYTMRNKTYQGIGLKTKKAWLYAYAKKNKGDDVNGKRKSY